MNAQATSDPKTRPPMDPRIKARRVAVTREQGRRRLRVVVTFGIAVALAALGWMVLHSPFLDVDHVDVIGARNATAGEVRRAARVARGEATLFVNLHAVTDRVEALPWVKQASVARVMPGRIRVVVVERTPTGWIRRSRDQVEVVDASGRVIAWTDKIPEHVPELRGVRGAAAGEWIRTRVAARVPAQLPKALVERTVLETVHNGEVTLTLSSGPEVRLGPPDLLHAKGAAALAVIDQLGEETVQYVDVRVPGVPVTG